WQQHRRGSIALDLSLSTHQASAAGEELDSINLYKLMMVYEKAINRYENHTADARHTVEKYPYTIEQQKAIIASLVTINKRMDFRSVVTHSDNKVHFVYNFLAILE